MAPIRTLRAMAALGPGPHRAGDMADMRVQSFGPRHGGLIGKGMVYSPGHGDTAPSVPMFDEYMIRSIPTWQPASRPAARE
jgi:hypothetical protein